MAHGEFLTLHHRRITGRLMLVLRMTLQVSWWVGVQEIHRLCSAPSTSLNLGFRDLHLRKEGNYGLDLRVATAYCRFRR